jgi:hypothetical protein
VKIIQKSTLVKQRSKLKVLLCPHSS